MSESIASSKLEQWNAVARRMRRHVIAMSHRAGAAHLGSALSCVDILAAAYWGALEIDPQRPDDPSRDRLILSKGHASSALYAALAERGFFSLDELQTYGAEGGRLAEQMGPHCAPGVEAATGSLGHGLPLGAGMALAGQLTKARGGREHRVLVVVSDGECNEGSVWEAAMFAAARELRNLAVVVDANGWQATGRSPEILRLEPLVDKWSAFGWDAVEVDGHDIGAVVSALRQSSWGASDPARSSKPTALVARTTKGKGVSFMEDDNNWHYRSPNVSELEAAYRELDGSR